MPYPGTTWFCPGVHCTVLNNEYALQWHLLVGGNKDVSKKPAIIKFGAMIHNGMHPMSHKVARLCSGRALDS